MTKTKGSHPSKGSSSRPGAKASPVAPRPVKTSAKTSAGSKAGQVRPTGASKVGKSIAKDPSFAAGSKVRSTFSRPVQTVGGRPVSLLGVFAILAIIAIIVVVLVLALSKGRSAPTADAPATPTATVLEEAYAAGAGGGAETSNDNTTRSDSDMPQDPKARDGMYNAPPAMTIDRSKVYLATFETAKGNIVIELYADKAPNTVNNFVFLARAGFYDGTTFHRVISGFMAQGGDPTGTGRGGPGYRFADEFSADLKHDGPGVLSMANSGANTNGSQFFITLAATPWLDGKHTVFGKVVEGMDVLNSISLRDPSSATTPGDLIKTIQIDEASASRLPEPTAEALVQPGEIEMPEDPRLRNNLYPARPAMVIDQAKDYTATIKTAKGDIVIELFDDDVPNTVNNFVFLAREGFYDKTTFHRVIADFMAQAGDPTGTGMGGPGYQFADEFVSTLKHDGPGVLSMANAGANTNGSQFFITFTATPWLDGAHTVFGKVTEGLDVLAKISLRDPSTATTPGELIDTVVISEK